MRLKSERIMIGCPACKEQYKIPKKSKIIQEVDIQLAPKKKNPFIALDTFEIIQDKMVNSYEKVLCNNCGNLFVFWTGIRIGTLKEEDKDVTTSTMCKLSTK